MPCYIVKCFLLEAMQKVHIKAQVTDQKQNLIQVKETSRKSKIQNLAHSIHFSFYFQQEATQSHAISVLLGASGLFLWE